MEKATSTRAAPSSVRRHAAALVASLFVLVSIPFDLVPLLRGPAPYPPEWQWAFRPEGPARRGRFKAILAVLCPI